MDLPATAFRRPGVREIQRSAEAGNEVIERLPLEGRLVTNPENYQFAVKKIQRNRAQVAKGQLVNSRIVIGIDARLVDPELVCTVKPYLWHARLYLIVSHAEAEPSQLW